MNFNWINFKESTSQSDRLIKIALTGFLTLFLELFLIRFVSTEIRVFAYINNIVLLACFIGIGAGALLEKEIKSWALLLSGLLLLCLVSSSEIFKEISNVLSTFQDFHIWYASKKTYGMFELVRCLLFILSIFCLLVLTFIPLGAFMAKQFEKSKDLTLAYSLNIFSDIFGIWAFSALGFLFCPPWVWLCLFWLVFFLLIRPNLKNSLSFFGYAAILVFLLIPTSNVHETIWGPYQKIEHRKVNYNHHKNIHSEVYVNNVLYMYLLDLSDEFFINNFGEVSLPIKKASQYDLPYRFMNNIDRALILGAGGGNGPASAIRNGVKEVHAVEIDPTVFALGKLHHPEKPYENDKVKVFIDDARSFLKNSKEKYDVISFGLLDSHTTVSSYTNAKLDHYVYTKESLRDAKKLLSPKGMFFLSFQPLKPWISQKIYQMIEEVFNEKPIVINTIASKNSAVLGPGGALFIIPKDRELFFKQIENDSTLKALFKNREMKIKEDPSLKIPTDDWPYLYLEKNHIPYLYFVIISVLALVLIPLRKLCKQNSEKIDHFYFFMGAGFLLLEFQNISKASLIFGSTWLVNSYIFSTILLMILAANYISTKINFKMNTAFYLLFLSLAILYFVPADFGFLSGNSTFIKCFAVIALNTPIFLASLIFIKKFSSTENRHNAYGSNLLGASIGGFLEIFSFIFGIKFLLLAALTFYIFAWKNIKAD